MALECFQATARIRLRCAGASLRLSRFVPNPTGSGNVKQVAGAAEGVGMSILMTKN